MRVTVAAPPLRPTEGYVQEFSRTVEPATHERVRILSNFPEGLALKEWPVTFGVPFPRGALRSTENVRIVTADGTEVPAQIMRTAAWHHADGDVRWILIDITARKDMDYFVEYGTEISRRDGRSPLLVNQAGEVISVITGPLRATFSRERSYLIDGICLDGDGNGRFDEPEQMLRARRRMWMTDHNGVRYETSDKLEDYEIEVETQGPQRVVVKASGWCRDETGAGLCKYVTRVHLYAGMPFVRIIHTFIVAFDTDRTQLRDIAVPFDLAGNKAKGVFLPTETGFAARTIESAVPSHLVQDSADHFSIRDAADKVLQEGNRVGGWINLITERGGIGVGLRNMWQEYPKELEAASQGITAHLWPLHGARLLDFRAPAVLGEERYEKWKGLQHYRGGLDKYDQAMGLAKTSEMILAFHGADATPAACAALEHPPFLVTDPAWMCKSDAFGPLHPYDPDRFPDIERKYRIAFSRLEFIRRHLGNYGFFDYGDVNWKVNWSEEAQRWLSRAWRRTASRFYGVCVTPWIQFARTGERHYRRWAIGNARHVMDIDMCHITARINDKEAGKYFPPSEQSKYAGGRYGGNGGIIHYAHNLYGLGCDSHVSQWAYYYYLTGYRRAWDVLNEEGEFYLGFFERYKSVAQVMNGYRGRHTGGGIRTMIQLWNATWDRRYLDAAHRMAEFCYEQAAGNERGTIESNDAYCNTGYVTYYQATGDERMKELILRNMRALNEDRLCLWDERHFTYYGPAMAYYFTGEPSYLRRALFWLQLFQDDVDVGDDPLWRGVMQGRAEITSPGLALLYSPYLLGALETLEEPVEPAGDFCGADEIWVDNPDGRAFTMEIGWHCYDGQFGHLAGKWREYCVKRRPKSRLVVLDGEGNVAVSVPMIFEETPKGTRVALEVPQGTPGVYRVLPQGAEAIPVKLVLRAVDPLKQWVIPIRSGSLSQGGSYYFYVPDDREQITVRYKIMGLLRLQAKALLLNPTGGTVEEKTHKFVGGTPQAEWATWSVPVLPGQRGNLWEFRVRPQVNEIKGVLLRIDGVPPVVSTTRRAFFVPLRMHSETVEADKITEPPANVQTAVRTIPAGKGLAVPRGAKLGPMQYQHVDARRGTLELWLRPDWAPDNLDDITFIQFGPHFRMYRRSKYGVYVRFGKDLLSSFIVLRPRAWHHIAFAWGLDTATPSAHFLVDGVCLSGGPLKGYDKETMGDWIGPDLKIGCNAPLHITGLRISDRSRLDRLEQGELSPPPDEHTLYHDQGP